MLTELGWLDVALVVLSALMIGFSKAGVPSAGMFAVTVMAMIFPARESVGIILPMLITGDIVAVAYYRRQVVWKHLISLIPWVLAGIVAGYFVLKWISDFELKETIGILVLALIVLHLVRERYGQKIRIPAAVAAAFNPFLGFLAGFTTMIGNAAGGVMSIYLLGKKLPKHQFVGTGAWFFLTVNLIKVPFTMELGLTNDSSLLLNAWMVPAVLAGAWIGVKVLPKIPERLFQQIILLLSALGAIKLIF